MNAYIQNFVNTFEYSIHPTTLNEQDRISTRSCSPVYAQCLTTDRGSAVIPYSGCNPSEDDMAVLPTYIISMLKT